MVEFIDRYLDDDELYRVVASSDVVVTPYETLEQVTSGVLVDAVAAGRPVVATRFPHAAEMLEGGAGLVVDHDPTALAAGVRTMIEDDDTYNRAVETTAIRSSQISWESGAQSFADLARSLIPADVSIHN